MSESPSLIADPRRLLKVFQDLCKWADKITICTSRIESAGGRSPSWQALANAKANVLVIVSDRTTDQVALNHLHKPASLRIVEDARGRYRPNVYLFQRENKVAALVGTARLVPADFMSSLTVMVHWQGGSDDGFACELANLVEQCRAIARIPGSGPSVSEGASTIETPQNLNDCSDTINNTDSESPTIRTDSRYLRFLLPTPVIYPDFPIVYTSIDSLEDRVGLAWGVLLGAGPLAMSDAIRFVASRFRELGLAFYERLRSTSLLYQAISTAIHEGIKLNHFDCPTDGEVRALQPLAVHFDDILWDTCLVTSLGNDYTAQEDAVRFAADWANDMVGLEFKFIQREGRIEIGLLGAIARLVNRGVVEQDSRGYVRRVAN